MGEKRGAAFASISRGKASGHWPENGSLLELRKREAERGGLSPQGLAPRKVQGVGEEAIPTVFANQIDLPQVNIPSQIRFIFNLHFLDQPFHADLDISFLFRQVSIEVGIDSKIHNIFQASGREIPATTNTK